MKTLALLTLLSLFLVTSCISPLLPLRDRIDLSGSWYFAMDTADAGIVEKWYTAEFSDTIPLPGTMDQAQKGFRNTDTTTMHLNRLRKYEGVAWYRTMVTIPENFREKHIELILERSKTTMVWVDSLPAGHSRLLQSPQHFDLTGMLTPGIHELTIRVDNRLSNTPYGNVHIYSDDTQTNWNGILGTICLEAKEPTYIDDLQVYPDIEQQKIHVKAVLANLPDTGKVQLELQAKRIEDGKIRLLSRQVYRNISEPILEVDYELGKETRLWDDCEQVLYRLTAVLSCGSSRDVTEVPFGMRNFKADGTQFAINGRTTFLRGKHEAAVFPLTGFPPMNKEEWTRVYRIARTYGINHYRFHSYCPPEAAFEAADEEGIFLQAELPFWGGLDSDSLAMMLREEGLAMLKNYANHPSFVLFSHGNEIWSGHDRVEENIRVFREADNRPCYTMGANNNIGYAEPRSCSDFFIGARTPYAFDTVLTHTRLSQAYADSREGGILNTTLPSTDFNYSYAVEHIPMPLISHEIGQYQVYPDYREISKYTGVLRAWNLEVFQKRLEKAGMAGLDSAFHIASGVWAARCYRAEMEGALRTGGLAGFQLLDLQDFPGQGTALVGILDAFMDSKQLITPGEWRNSCNDIVLLATFPGYCWTSSDTFRADILLVNYSDRNVRGSLNWKITDKAGKVFSDGVYSVPTENIGGIIDAGLIEMNLSPIKGAEQLELTLQLSGTGIQNKYPLWVYPPPAAPDIPEGILVTEHLSDKVLAGLEDGASVLYFPAEIDILKKSYPGHFPPEFWNYGMFKGISEWTGKPVSPGTLGLLIRDEHPLFKSFPTSFHTDWQWFSIIKEGRAMILDELSGNYLPVVQVIDNLERNQRLGLIFEFSVGNGRLLVCSSPLHRLNDRPEAMQLYRSMLEYMSSESFRPGYSLSHDKLKELFLTGD